MASALAVIGDGAQARGVKAVLKLHDGIGRRAASRDPHAGGVGFPDPKAF